MCAKSCQQPQKCGGVTQQPACCLQCLSCSASQVAALSVLVCSREQACSHAEVGGLARNQHACARAQELMAQGKVPAGMHALMPGGRAAGERQEVGVDVSINDAPPDTRHFLTRRPTQARTAAQPRVGKTWSAGNCRPAASKQQAGLLAGRSNLPLGATCVPVRDDHLLQPRDRGCRKHTVWLASTLGLLLTVAQRVSCPGSSGALSRRLMPPREFRACQRSVKPARGAWPHHSRRNLIRNAYTLEQVWVHHAALTPQLSSKPSGSSPSAKLIHGVFCGVRAQDDIGRRTGTVLTVRGRYYPPGVPRDERDPPLLLHIAPGACHQEARCFAEISALLFVFFVGRAPRDHRGLLLLLHTAHAACRRFVWPDPWRLPKALGSSNATPSACCVPA